MKTPTCITEKWVQQFSALFFKVNVLLKIQTRLQILLGSGFPVSGTVVHSIKQLTAASGNANLILWAAMGKCDIFLSKDKECRCH